MIVRRACPFRRTASRANGVRIVKTDEPFSVRRMQRQRIAYAMRALLRRRHTLHDEFDPVFAGRIDDEHDAIKRKKVVQARILFSYRHCEAQVIIR